MPILPFFYFLFHLEKKKKKHFTSLKLPLLIFKESEERRRGIKTMNQHHQQSHYTPLTKTRPNIAANRLWRILTLEGTQLMIRVLQFP